MSKLAALREALAHSPANSPLLLLFARAALDAWALHETRGASVAFGGVAACLWLGAILVICGVEAGVTLQQFGTSGSVLSTWLAATPLLKK